MLQCPSFVSMLVFRLLLSFGCSYFDGDLRRIDWRLSHEGCRQSAFDPSGRLTNSGSDAGLTSASGTSIQKLEAQATRQSVTSSLRVLWRTRHAGTSTRRAI